MGQIPIYEDITTYLIFIGRNVWIIAAVTIIGSILTFVVLQQQPEIYEANSTVIVSPRVDGDEEDILRVIDVIRFNVLGTYVQILRSRTNRQEAISAVLAELGLQRANNVVIEVRPVENSSVIAITVRAENPELAQALANELADRQIGGTLESLERLYPMSILDPAVLPVNPVSPQTRLSLLLGVMGSFILSLVLAFGFEIVKNRSVRQTSAAS